MPRFSPAVFKWQQIWMSLNRNMGSAYTASTEFDQLSTVASVKNFATSYPIASYWNSSETLRNQFDPNKMFAYLGRWEQILGIVPSKNSTIVDRQSAIATKLLLVSKFPNLQGVKDKLKEIIPQIFVDIVTRAPSDSNATFPGGLTIPGGVHLSDGPFLSYLNNILIRIWQPRDHNGNVLISDRDFYQQRLKYVTFLNDFLPTYVNFNTLRYFNSNNGTITMTAGSNTVNGTSTFFTSSLSNGSTFETVDDNNQLQTFTVLNITSNTLMTVTTVAPNNNTNGTYRTIGFILDVPHNLDNSNFNP